MLAIVIPYYKITFFEETLISLSNQTNKDFKVYIGDDNSPENPEKLLEKYKDKLEFVYQKFDENLGSKSLTKQWERCIDLTNNENWIMILGDDDALGSNVVEAFYENIKEVISLNVNVIRYQTVKINELNKKISDIYENPKIESITNFLHRKYSQHVRTSLSEHIFSKKALIDSKFIDFPLAWYSDIVAIIQASNFKNIYSINSSTIYIRYSKINISGKSDNLLEKNKASILFAKFLLQNIRNFNSLHEIYNIIEKYYLENKKEFILLFKMIFFLAISYQFQTLCTLFFKIFKAIFYANR